MNTTAIVVNLVGFAAFWLATLVASIAMYLNRKPGASLFVNPVMNPDSLTERGLAARKWVIVLSVCGALWIVLGWLVGVIFFHP